MESVSFEEKLKQIAATGIQANDVKLKKDMISQFDDPLLYARELVVNSFDAGASCVEIRGQSLQEGLVSITYTDNGSGMDRKAITNYTSIFTSYKPSAEAAIGTHGIGKLAVMKIPGLRRFSLVTCTGQEAWMFKAKDLISSEPITIHRIDPAKYPKGTSIEVVFETSKSLREEMLAIENVLIKSVRYLKIDTLVHIPEEHSPAYHTVHNIRQPWKTSSHHTRIYFRERMGLQFEFQLSINNGDSELYQKYVLITKKPLVTNNNISFLIPYLTIRVNCNQFELPFGRHRIMDEEAIMESISCILLNDILPDYFQYLRDLTELPIKKRKRRFLTLLVLEEITVGLLLATAEQHVPWTHFPLFLTMNYGRISFEKLDALIRENKDTLYLDTPENAGTDYSSFSVPVLSHTQPPSVIEVINIFFGNKLINLAACDIAIESPGNPVLTREEELLQEYLAFDRRMFKQYDIEETNDDVIALFNLSGAIEQSQAENSLEEIEWRVNYLLERDGHTPCISRRFITKQDSTIVLNLNHPDVKMLCKLSSRDPLLAGHLGLEMVLSEGAKPFNHLTSAVKDSLILLDAIMKCGYEPDKTVSKKEIYNERLREFFRNISDNNFGCDSI